jgi:hypothetical protein
VHRYAYPILLIPLRMTKILCLLCFAISISSAFAQYSYTAHDDSNYATFFTTKTGVRLTGVASIDTKIKKTLADAWSFTEIVYIKPYEGFQGNDCGSVIRLVPVSAIDSYTAGVIYEYTSLCVILPGATDVSRMTNVIASVPVKCTNSPGRASFMQECTFDQIGYKIDVLLKQLIEVISFVGEHEYTPKIGNAIGINKYVRQFNKVRRKEGRTLSGSKTLIVNKSAFTKYFRKEDFRSLYSFPIRIVEEHEYKDILESKGTEYMILLTGNTPTTTLSVYDFESDKTLFIDLNWSPGNPKEKRAFRLNSAQVIALNYQILKIIIKD